MLAEILLELLLVVPFESVAADQVTLVTAPAEQLVQGCVATQSTCRFSWQHLAVDLGPTESSIRVINTNTEWHVSCSIDNITDERSCALASSSQVPILIELSNRRAAPRVCVIGGNSYPGSSDFIRIDSNRPFATRESTAFSGGANILAQAKVGHKLLARYHPWPLNNAVDGETDLTNFDNIWRMYRAIAASQFRGEMFPPGAPAPRRFVKVVSSYPSVALRLGHEGLVKFEITFSAAGDAIKCDVLQSSGFAELDQATCDTFTKVKWPSSDGLEHKESDSIRWILPRD